MNVILNETTDILREEEDDTDRVWRTKMKSHKWNRKWVLEMVLITICATSEVKQQRERDTANVDDKSTQHAFLCTWFGFSKMQQLKRRSSPKKLMNNDAGPDSYLHFSYRETEYRVMQCCCNHSKPLATALQSVALLQMQHYSRFAFSC